MTDIEEREIVNSPGFETDEHGLPVESPSNIRELAEYFGKLHDAVFDDEVILANNAQGYGRCVEAMWRFAYAAHQLMAKELAVTGYQHGMSSLLLLGKLNMIDGPYIILKGEDELFPQSDPVRRLEEFLEDDDVREWLSAKAEKLLNEYLARPVREFNGKEVPAAHPAVVAHWRKLVEAGRGAS